MLSAPRNRIVMIATTIAMVAITLVGPAGAGAQTATCFGERATITARPGTVTYGTSGRDVIVGTSGADTIRARGGGDLICSGGGDDRVYGGYGADLIDLGTGNDYGRGGPGADQLWGGTGSDLMRGRGGDDIVRGEGGVDECYGGKGRDSLHSCNETPASVLSDEEARMVELVLDLRSRHGAGSLDVNVHIVDVARDWSGELPERFRHNPNVGNEIPSGWWAWGENIAYNGSIDAAFNALVNSPGHFNNMVNPNFTDIGIGVHIEGSRVYVTQVFARY